MPFIRGFIKPHAKKVEIEIEVKTKNLFNPYKTVIVIKIPINAFLEADNKIAYTIEIQKVLIIDLPQKLDSDL